MATTPYRAGFASGTAVMTVGGVFSGFAAAGRVDPWNSNTFLACFALSLLGAAIVTGLAMRFGYEWLKRRRDGGDEMPQRPNPKKPKGVNPASKKEKNIGAKDVQQGDHNQNIGKRVNNYGPADNSGLVFTGQNKGIHVIRGDFSGNGGDGIYVGPDSDVEIMDPTVRNNGRDGLHIEGREAGGGAKTADLSQLPGWECADCGRSWLNFQTTCANCGGGKPMADQEPPIESGPTAELLDKLMQVSKSEADEMRDDQDA